MWDDGNDSPRTLGIRDKQILYRNAGKRCQNPTCGKKIDFDEMEVGHKTAWSRGGRTTFNNSVCLCHRCNKLQGTDSWATFLKKQGIEDPKAKLKESLRALSVQQLKSLAQKHQVKVTGRVEEDWFESRRGAPTKTQYVNKLAAVVTKADVDSLAKAATRTPSRPKSKRQ